MSIHLWLKFRNDRILFGPPIVKETKTISCLAKMKKKEKGRERKICCERVRNKKMEA